MRVAPSGDEGKVVDDAPGLRTIGAIGAGVAGDVADAHGGPLAAPDATDGIGAMDGGGEADGAALVLVRLDHGPERRHFVAVATGLRLLPALVIFGRDEGDAAKLLGGVTPRAVGHLVVAVGVAQHIGGARDPAHDHGLRRTLATLREHDRGVEVEIGASGHGVRVAHLCVARSQRA